MIEVILLIVGIVIGFIAGFFLGKVKAYQSADISAQMSVMNNLSTQIAEMKVKFEEVEKARREIEKQREKFDEEREKRFREFVNNVHKLFEELTEKTIKLDEEKDKRIEELMEHMKKFFEEFDEERDKRFREFVDNIHRLFKELSEKTTKLDEEKDKRIKELMEQMKKFFEEQKRHTEQFLLEQGKSREEIEKRRDAQIEDMKRMISMFTKAISGTKTRGLTGEILLREALKESIKVGLIKCNLKTDNGEVEFAWDLGDGKYIPIDSKMPDVFEILQKYNTTNDTKEQENYKKIIIDKIRKEIKRVQKYQNLSNTTDSCILVVPEGILDIAPELISMGEQNNVFICSYKDVFLIAHTLQDQYIRLKEEGDVGKYKQIIKSLFQILDNINKKTESIEKALTTIRNANEKIKIEVIKGKRAEEYVSEEDVEEIYG